MEASTLPEARAILRDMISRLKLSHFAIIPTDTRKETGRPNNSGLLSTQGNPVWGAYRDQMRGQYAKPAATIHAEANAILQAAMNGVRIEGSEIYTTASPCSSKNRSCRRSNRSF